VPPVMAFHLGSLGFLSPFEFFEYQEKVEDVLQGWSVVVVIIEHVYSPSAEVHTQKISNKQYTNIHKKDSQLPSNLTWGTTLE